MKCTTKEPRSSADANREEQHAREDQRGEEAPHEVGRLPHVLREDEHPRVVLEVLVGRLTEDRRHGEDAEQPDDPDRAEQ
jgi:hypothetical protein